MEAQGLQDWSFDELPGQVEIGAELTLIRYPTLVDNIDSVAIELFADKELAAQTMRKGLVRLYMLRSAQQKNALKKKFTRFVKNNALGLFGKMPGLVEDVIAASYAAAFAIDEQLPGNRAAFEKSLQQGKPKIRGV